MKRSDGMKAAINYLIKKQWKYIDSEQYITDNLELLSQKIKEDLEYLHATK